MSRSILRARFLVFPTLLLALCGIDATALGRPPQRRPDLVVPAVLAQGSWLPRRLQNRTKVTPQRITDGGLVVGLYAVELFYPSPPGNFDPPPDPKEYSASVRFPAVTLSQGRLLVDRPEESPLEVGYVLREGGRLVPVLYPGYHVRLHPAGADLEFPQAQPGSRSGALPVSGEPLPSDGEGEG